MNITVAQNAGIISTGNHTQNIITSTHIESSEAIDWDRLEKEIQALKESSDASITQFTCEAAEAIQKQDAGKIKTWLSKWIPRIGKLVETSYYIIEISAKFGIM